MKYSRLMLGLLLVLLAGAGVWLLLQASETKHSTVILPNVLSDPTVSSTSLVSSNHATSTATQGTLPTQTQRVMITQAPSPTVRHAPTATLPPPTVTPSPTATPTPPPANAVHLVIASIGVDAPVEVIGINADGVMETPSSPINVGWYDFSAHPGEVGNIVFAGHVDYHDYGEAVFWYLDTIQLGDIIDVQTDDDRTVSYRVTKLENFSGDVDARTITAATSTPTITLITCEGDFDPSTRSYDKRLVVVGELVSK